MVSARRLCGLLLACAGLCAALTPAEVLVVANRNSPVSKSIAEYYARKRGIAPEQILYLETTGDEEIGRDVYDREVAGPLGAYLKRRGWVDRILAIVTTSGVPLKIRGTQGLQGDAASVDSELAALYQDLKGRPHALKGPMLNPYHRADGPFRHPEWAIYLVTRLTGYTFADVRGLIDRGAQAQDSPPNRGVVVLDLKGLDMEDGNLWLKMAANRLPVGRVVLDESSAVVRGVRDVIGYGSWGSNDPERRERDVHFTYLPGAIVTEYVSTDGRTFQEPPANWTLGGWKNLSTHFAGSPQSLSGDFVRQGATGVSGHVYEPYLMFTPRPDVLFPAYLSGRTLAESYYLAIPAVSWMNIVIGDPLCHLPSQRR